MNIYEKYTKKFEQKGLRLNSLIASSIIPNELSKKHQEEERFMKDDQTNGLHMMSGLYLYTNPPPYGYGSPAPKVADTVLRSYDYNKAEDKEMKHAVFGHKILDTRIYDINGFSSNETMNNFNPQLAKHM